MLLNEILYLLSGCMAILLVSLIYLKYRERKLREALNYHVRQFCEEILVLNDAAISIVNKRKIELENEIKGLLRDYEETDKTFH